MPYRILSFGAGVQTTALILLEKFDEVVFADTGSEKPETYAYIEKYIKPYLASTGTKWTVVIKGDTLEEYCLKKRNVPSIKYRSSTRDFKVLPIRRYIKRLKLQELPSLALGISVDEVERANNKDPPEYHKVYPLLERGLSRTDCEKIIQKHGWPVPLKSGCFFCPFNPVPMWNWLWINHRDYYDRAVKLEENAKLRRPRIHLADASPSLRTLPEKFYQTLDTFPICESGYCMT